jgi:hypothetical protein
MATAPAYPTRVEAELEPRLSRWLWLVKWFLAIPHVIVLSFLWLAYGVLTVVAFFAILATGRYPRPIFDFNVGVLRWSWRVTDYAFGVLGTDRYPPFTLKEVPDYPAHLEVAYPERLSRRLALIKWWLLAIPHYLIVAIFAGGGSWLAWNTNNGNVAVYGNLIGLLALIAAVILADPNWQATRAETIHAPAKAVWPWLVQLGYGRGGYYGDLPWVARRAGPWGGRQRRSGPPELQHLDVGRRTARRRQL